MDTIESSSNTSGSLLSLHDPELLDLTDADLIFGGLETATTPPPTPPPETANSSLNTPNPSPIPSPSPTNTETVGALSVQLEAPASPCRPPNGSWRREDDSEDEDDNAIPSTATPSTDPDNNLSSAGPAPGHGAAVQEKDILVAVESGQRKVALRQPQGEDLRQVLERKNTTSHPSSGYRSYAARLDREESEELITPQQSRYCRLALDDPDWKVPLPMKKATQQDITRRLKFLEEERQKHKEREDNPTTEKPTRKPIIRVKWEDHSIKTEKLDAKATPIKTEHKDGTPNWTALRKNGWQMTPRRPRSPVDYKGSRTTRSPSSRSSTRRSYTRSSERKSSDVKRNDKRSTTTTSGTKNRSSSSASRCGKNSSSSNNSGETNNEHSTRNAASTSSHSRSTPPKTNRAKSPYQPPHKRPGFTGTASPPPQPRPNRIPPYKPTTQYMPTKDHRQNSPPKPMGNQHTKSHPTHDRPYPDPELLPISKPLAFAPRSFMELMSFPTTLKEVQEQERLLFLFEQEQKERQLKEALEARAKKDGHGHNDTNNNNGTPDNASSSRQRANSASRASTRSRLRDLTFKLMLFVSLFALALGNDVTITTTNGVAPFFREGQIYTDSETRTLQLDIPIQPIIDQLSDLESTIATKSSLRFKQQWYDMGKKVMSLKFKLIREFYIFDSSMDNTRWQRDLSWIGGVFGLLNSWELRDLKSEEESTRRATKKIAAQVDTIAHLANSEASAITALTKWIREEKDDNDEVFQLYWAEDNFFRVELIINAIQQVAADLFFHRLSPAAADLFNLTQTWQQLEDVIHKGNRVLPDILPFHLFQLHANFKANRDSLRIIIEIPTISRSAPVYDLLRWNPIPLYHNKLAFHVQDPGQHLAVHNNSIAHIIFSQRLSDNCVTLNKILYCNLPVVVHQRRAMTCLHAIYLADWDAIADLCVLSAYRTGPQAFHINASAFLIHTGDADLDAVINCDNSPPRAVSLKGQEVVQFNQRNCTLNSAAFNLRPALDIMTTADTVVAHFSEPNTGTIANASANTNRHPFHTVGLLAGDVDNILQEGEPGTSPMTIVAIGLAIGAILVVVLGFLYLAYKAKTAWAPTTPTPPQISPPMPLQTLPPRPTTEGAQ